MSGTTITTPSVGSTGHSGAASGGVSGAASGASAGFAAGGPWGAVIGGVVGAAAGIFGGNQMDRAAEHLAKARAWATAGKEREAAIQMRDMLRQFRIKRAMAMAAIGAEEGGTRSSSPMGAIGAFGAQYAFGKGFFEGQVFIQRKVNKQLEKANKDQQAANMTFGMIDAAASAVSAWGNAGGMGPGAAAATGEGGPVSSSGSLGSNTYAGGDWSSFYPT